MRLLTILLAICFVVLAGAISYRLFTAEPSEVEPDQNSSTNSGFAGDELSTTPRTKIVSDYNVPIEFFGRVVDQGGVGLQGAQVKLSVKSRRRIPNAAVGIHTEAIELVSGKNGIFVLKGAKGYQLAIESITLRRYELQERVNKGFRYGPSRPARHIARAESPVVYRLWKTGEGAYIKPFNWDKKIRADGSDHYMDLNRRKVSQTPIASTLVVKAAIQRSPLEQKWGRWNVDEWVYEISIPGGGIQETSDVFLYRPPAEGYSNSISAAFVKTGDTIQMRDKISVYVRFESGTYGGGTIQVWADRSDDEALVWLELNVNPDGSPNLEHDPRAQSP